MKKFLFESPILPDGFRFPETYRQLVESNSRPDIEPWTWLADNMPQSLSYYGAMLEKFKEGPLVPFAIICDETGLHNDGYVTLALGYVTLALFDGSDISDSPRVRIYDYSNPKKGPWDNLRYNDFEEWLVAAREESADYKTQRAEIDDSNEA
ncbi:hypothetical protein G6M87_15380 [Rhizobium rhizogenes]|uniref:Knr4/Smi1-like domain-containing protein n=1 Tax=Rhizobium rhizogenes (strain K84 / ATCC BAA-868) TaxID=311403 RepID=B9J8W6_RHIR8|nr:hypothetical protein [Rhizobium rhizogenes]ACM27504.1 conserved hypothetical protein [Rhizobium rhizogenes K84]NTF82105.1 hypothetical protein [Rhizobium rhizogenes]NTH78123.1 hypothetical protein [Rhizobium rhizogenes]NTH84131.1 hypothetical protein [Rhizobium rhizogenes]NTI23250.1 hypothetical protein [Rhizobium rhizogenes]